MGDEIGGHNVSGHVHTTASIVEVQQTADNRRLRFQARPRPSTAARLLVCAAE